ncbi:hypothetical protein TrCOL_g12950 [Triparma columacea]|uniref:RING-type domain-containing protein n=1 Tax=Triparma columacea TaxID=722753 RepID=A0A9W7GCW0_9STRA|nr:hypothetical protein TrCOL_g12950 [Triparma columacea]
MPNGPLRPPSFNASGGPPPRPIQQLRSLSASELPADATQSQRAQMGLQETLGINFFKLVIIWSFLFLTMTCTYFGCLIWAFSVFGFGKDLDRSCNQYLIWMWCFIGNLVFHGLFGPIIKKKLGLRQGEPPPPAVNRFVALQLHTSLLLLIVGLALSTNDQSSECALEEKPYIKSWQVLCAMGLVTNVIIYGGLGAIGVMLVWLARNGFLVDDKNAAPTNTVASLPTVDTLSATDEECSICLTKFDDSGDTIRKTPCGHCFHQKCLENWFKCSRTCPNCRADVVALKEGRGGGEELL